MEHWDGISWSVTPNPNPVGAPAPVLRAVSCPSANSCFAVGNANGTFNNPKAGNSLAEHWDGTSWSIMTNPASAIGTDLEGVSCRTTTSCVAVGQYHVTDIAGKTLAEQWNGKSWKITPSPNPPGYKNSQLAGVSCPSATSSSVSQCTTRSVPP